MQETALRTPAGLSAREVEVLQLLAAGKSNPEIAEALYISRFTVERRTIPGETTAAVMAEIEEAFARVRVRRPELDASVSMIFEQPPSDVSTEAPIVRALDVALRACGE